jgi:hypothetical protein
MPFYNYIKHNQKNERVIVVKEIPISYVRSNQWGIVIFVLFSIFFAQPLIIAVLWAVQVAGLTFGLKANAFIQLAKPLLKNRISGAPTEAAELQRFNNSIAVILLTFSLIGFGLGWSAAGYIFAATVALAAFIAILGFCIGCFFYFQFKQWKTRG